MDIFVRHIPPHATTRQVERTFDGPLKSCGVLDYHVEKMRDKNLATITVLDSIAGQHFLDEFGVPFNAKPHAQGRKPLKWDGKFVQCCRSRNQPSDFSIRSLAHEASKRAASATTAATRSKVSPQSQPRNSTRFSLWHLQCGSWDHAGSSLKFVPHFKISTSGSITFGSREAIIILGPPESEHVRLDVKYYNCEHIVLGTYDDPTVTIALRSMAPKIYKVRGEDLLSAQLTALMLGSDAAKKKDVRKSRVVAIDDAHARVAGACFVYRLTLADAAVLSRIRSLLSKDAKKPSTVSMPTSLQVPEESWQRSKERLDMELMDTTRFGSKPFSLRFQLDRLARNGILPPDRVLQLLPPVSEIFEKYGLDATLSALSAFARDLPPVGPETQPADVSIAAFREWLEEYASTYDTRAPNNPYELNKRHAHINLIHKVVITPTGTYLEGPEPEPTNRVLRNYPDQTDHFIRVLFQDEDGSNVHYDPRASQELIYHDRFKRVLDGVINIAGQGFSFLGFSHSSLRSQSCWFMAPLLDKSRTPQYAPQVIKALGDFSHIQSPAKCAARIGQCFTDTTSSVSVQPGEISALSVVERNGYDFSDGCGTISQSLLREVWRVYGSKRLLKPTVLQIRFQGAKGVVSLDSRLSGRQLNLRANMLKFMGSSSHNLEICGAAFRPLPMILNRQFIKILEDLGIPTQVFMRLQDKAVNNLRRMLDSATNTASLLETLELPKAAHLPELISLLDEIGLDHQKDAFLYSVVEMAAVNQLRDIKYRGRIPVEAGVTLYGIMDETGVLNEGEIYVATERGPDGGRDDRPRKNVVVTRSPAMHPGDVQVVDIVDVPADSPLKRLSNVVVFSQKGDRDLPSKLSGGDLDGDLYNVIWDKHVVPSTVAEPAKYPRLPAVDLGRPVTAKDMSDFFVTFMETDQLGMLCNVHMQLADQQPMGTFSPECIKLAQMASTAVDYSKTGIPINMQECPRYDRRIRPDFMAPSPRVIVSDKGYLDIEEDEAGDDEAFEGLDTEQRPYRYYESAKALGHLYRAIDERKFIEDLQRQHLSSNSRSTTSPVLTAVLDYVLKSVSGHGVLFEHHLILAKDIRASYEETLLEIMYNYCPHSHSCLSEAEVFSGSILGRHGGAQGKPLRELSKTMRERFDAIVEYATMRIVHGDDTMREADDLDDLYDEREFEALPRAVACLQVAVKERGWVGRPAGEMRSFAYMAANVCLKELRRYRITTFGLRILPRVGEL